VRDRQGKYLLLRIAEVLLPRLSLIEPQQAFNAVDQIKLADPDTEDESFLLRRIIGGLGDQKNPSEKHWPIFLAAASRITDSGPLSYALLEMLSASKRLRFDERRRPVCQTIAALAFGPRELVLNNIEGVTWAAIAADPEVRGQLIGIGNRVKALLAVDLDR
jgi:hypothetical protein